MKCPKCGSAMETITYQTIEVDRCTGCAGLWFDMLEEKHMKALAGSESIDIGSARTGKKQDRMGNIKCPRCGTSMVKMVVNSQPHIWYESCPVCYGTYFDAGEFRDFKAETFADRVRDIVRGERKQ